MALSLNGPIFEIEDYKAYYDFNNRLYVALIGCFDECFFNLQQAQPSNDMLNHYNPGYDYTDGYIMQSII